MKIVSARVDRHALDFARGYSSAGDDAQCEKVIRRLIEEYAAGHDYDRRWKSYVDATDPGNAGPAGSARLRAVLASVRTASCSANRHPYPDAEAGRIDPWADASDGTH